MSNRSKSQRRREARRLRLNLALQSIRDTFLIHDTEEVQETFLEIFHLSQITDVDISREDRETQWIVYTNLRKMIDACSNLVNG